MSDRQNLAQNILLEFCINLLHQTLSDLKPNQIRVLQALRKLAAGSHKLPESYDEYMSSDEWKDKRQHWIKEGCGVCFATEGLHVHHLGYDNFEDEGTNDCIALCARCHAYVHQNRLLLKEWIDQTNKETVNLLEWTVATCLGDGDE